MKVRQLTLLSALLLLGACSSPSGTAPEDDGEPGDVAGGQSGTDGAGSYYCDLEDHTSTDIPLDQPLETSGSCSAEEAIAQLSTAGAFDCGALGTLELSVGTATGAHQLTGKFYNDTGDPGSGQDCYSLGVDVVVDVVSRDSSVSLEATGFVAGHFCSDFELEATAPDGHWILRVGVGGAASLVVIVDQQPAVLCSQVP